MRVPRADRAELQAVAIQECREQRGILEVPQVLVADQRERRRSAGSQREAAAAACLARGPARRVRAAAQPRSEGQRAERDEQQHDAALQPIVGRSSQADRAGVSREHFERDRRARGEQRQRDREQRRAVLFARRRRLLCARQPQCQPEQREPRERESQRRARPPPRLQEQCVRRVAEPDAEQYQPAPRAAEQRGDDPAGGRESDPAQQRRAQRIDRHGAQHVAAQRLAQQREQQAGDECGEQGFRDGHRRLHNLATLIGVSQAPDASAALVRDLCAWFDRAQRDLPWRRTRDPYAIWISEAMLQQTRVETVIPYWRRFLERFPDLRALAAAPEDSVVAAWSGLGYYRRARALREAARALVERHAGGFPRTRDAWLALPGVGPYTAGAVLSIAFDEPEPLVDGNVLRVFARLFAIAEPIDRPATVKRIWARAAELVPRRPRGATRPRNWNQALMELGATVCLPREPNCGECPVRAHCAARAAGRTAELPIVARR
ncbi:MAG: hypothetical protein FJ299_02270, partial [Planctomycetes bacterium]|nr:hypothetical protein [Planctomycetota bacterium]